MNDLNTISCLFLDIGGVILSKGWGHEFRQQSVDQFRLDANKMEELHNTLITKFEEGMISIDEYLDRVVFYTKRDFTITEFKNFMFSLSTPNLEMMAFIKKIKLQYGLKIIAVSNESREINAYRIKAFKLNEIFDFFISSCFVPLRKPDKAIFKLAIDVVQEPLNKIIYIDDTQIFVDIVRKMGITSICHAGYSSTAKALSELGVTIENQKFDNI